MSVRAWLQCEREGCPYTDTRLLLAKRFTVWRSWEPEHPEPNYEPSLSERMNVFFVLHEVCGDKFNMVIE